MHETDVRLKVHVVLETAAGERIAEVDNEHMFLGSFDELALRTAEANLARMLDATVLSPARTLIRAHVNKLLGKLSFRRRLTEPVDPLPEDTKAKADLDRRLMAIMAQAQGA